MAIVQTVDIIAPVVNDGFHFGRIAAANALSDVYAMGGEAWCAMNIACLPVDGMNEDTSAVFSAILQGGISALEDAEAVLVGGHTVEDAEIKYGLAVTGIIDPKHIAGNDGICPGDALILTKPVGTGILATAVKARFDGFEESERVLMHWCGMLNRGAAKVIRAMKLEAATDITGFGLGGHALEMAKASDVNIEIYSSDVPLLPMAEEYAKSGLIPVGSHHNRKHFSICTEKSSSVSQALESIIFDAQTSGGLLLAVPQGREAEALELLAAEGIIGSLVGRALPGSSGGGRLYLR